MPNPAAKPKNTPFVLIIRDGWGENPNPSHDPFNAVKLAKTPVAHRLDKDWPRTLIRTSGEDVGLTEGTMGNSEVGHQNIGAGRIVDQKAVRISKACRRDGGLGLKHNEVLSAAVSRAKTATRQGGTPAYVHLLCICSDAGVHGQLEHLYACVRLCKALGQDRVAVHLFTDGRDAGPFSGLGFVEQVEAELKKIGAGRISSIMGRYWAMDRDFRWERVERAYACLTGRAAKDGTHATAASAREAVQRHYDTPASDKLKGDEFLAPTMIGTASDAQATRIQSGDTVVFVNYRGDRPREIVSAFVLPDDQWAKVKPSPDSGKHGFDRGPRLALEFVTMANYSEALEPYVKIAFPRAPRMVNIAGDYLSSLGLRQFRCAETEKYPHVTYFFNGYRDGPFPGETRENPQSPKVATYDLKPEMAAPEVRDAVLRRLAATDCEDVLVVNFANADMVGHTGSLPAAIKACEAVDECAGRLIDATLARKGSLIVTADHGNAEQMWDPATNSPHTSHTIYDVPLYVIGEPFRGRHLRTGGRLADVLPTALAMMGLAKPAEMTGESLLEERRIAR